jgi:hypothetical protein
MALYEILPDELRALAQTSLASARVRERQDLQRLVRDQVEVLEEGLLVIAEEFGEWEESRRRIDLLAVDRQANLVVIELRRDDTGGHMELQALRYAAMVSTLTFEKCAEVFDAYLQDRGREHQDAPELLLNFLGWAEPDEDSFAQDVRIVLVAADFGKELTTAVLWLNQRDLDIRCIRLQPYSDGTRVLLNVQQVIPLPEAEEFQVQVREKARRERKARTDSRDLTRYDVKVRGKSFPNQPKRGALFHIVTILVRDMGIAPEPVHEADLSRPFDRAWVVVDGEVDEPTFIEQATRDRKEQGGYAFDPPRWYTGDDELLRHGGRTYAFSKMWGGAKWLRAMENLKQTFPEARIEFEPVD